MSVASSCRLFLLEQFTTSEYTVVSGKRQQPHTVSRGAQNTIIKTNAPLLMKGRIHDNEGIGHHGLLRKKKRVLIIYSGTSIQCTYSYCGCSSGRKHAYVESKRRFAAAAVAAVLSGNRSDRQTGPRQGQR